MPGRFMWYELMTTDAKAAGEFYRQVVGWKTQEMGDADNPYTTFHVGEANGMAGMLTLSETVRAGGATPVWMGYVGVDDVDAYTGRLTRAGGTVHQPPADIPGIGRFCGGADPGGAAFVIFKGSSPRDRRRAPRARPAMRGGTSSWPTLPEPFPQAGNAG